ncbi:MAG: TonB-dependent receptor plug domain-containing protein [Deltaproteobacteria bacterium]|nr:TonB-dependent receptor plug domain-containing protein [Deltaproteobacteria bacterium]
MIKGLKVLLTLTIGFYFIFGDIPSVFAQEESSTDEFTLEEITVTAQKREENQQKVPIAMEVITGEELASLGKDNVDEILKDVANVFINTAADGMRISLRGIADDSNAMDDQHVGGSTVAVNVDGSFNNMSNAGQNLFDIERVEVLFGPQSTMYGSNSPGGIVNVVTAAPKTDRYSASGTLEVGSYELLNLQAVFNAPVIRDKVALRLAANTYKQGSYVDPDEDPNKTSSVRLRALWDIYDKLTFTLTGNWQKRSNGGMMGGSVVPFVDQDNVDDPWTPDTSDEADPILGAPNKNRADQITKGASANIDWDIFLGTISAVPSYSKSTSEGRQSRTQNETTSYWNEERSFTQKGGELRMVNAEDFELFQWIFGGTLYKSEQYMFKDYDAATTTDETRITTQNKKALYANITYPTWFSDSLRLTFGYRQSWDENNSLKVGGFMAGTSGNPESYSKPDFKYGFEYDLAENLMLYGSYSSSYRSADAMSMPDASGNFPDPEELDAYTLGAKSRWFGNKLQVNASAYYYDYANKLCTGFKEALGVTEYDLGGDYMGVYEGGRGYQAQATPDGLYPTPDIYDLDEDGDTTEPVAFDLHDANSQGTGAFKSLGMDLQTSWIITSKDRLNFSIAYLSAEWIDLHFHYQWYMYWPDEDYKGVTPTNSPKFSMTASYEHNFMLGSYGTLTPRLDMQRKTSYSMVWNPADKDPEGYGHQKPYYLWDASATFSHSAGKWSVNTYVKNITNYAVKRSYMGMMSFTMMIGDPRIYGATLSVKF